MKIWDSYTIDRLQYLHPSIRDAVRDVILEAQKQGIHLRITQDGHYRSFDEQEQLHQDYLDGGPLAAPPGESYHNYGLAVDVVPVNSQGQPEWDSDNWEQIADIFAKHGFSWGFDLWGADKPHFQKTYGYDTQELLAILNNKQTIDSKYPNLGVA